MKFYTPDELSDLLGVPTSRLAQWRASERGPRFVKEGQTILYTEEAVAEWAQRQTVSPVRGHQRLMRVVD